MEMKKEQRSKDENENKGRIGKKRNKRKGRRNKWYNVSFHFVICDGFPLVMVITEEIRLKQE